MFTACSVRRLRPECQSLPAIQPAGVAAHARGNGLVRLDLSEESIADFAAWKDWLLAAFAGIGIGSLPFLAGLLAVRGLRWCSCWSPS